jgi:hypothetical protein
MSGVVADLVRFAAADVSAWSGLPTDLTLEELDGVFDLDPTFRISGELGSPPVAESWVSVYSEVFDRGLRLWCRDDVLTVVEGVLPKAADGTFLAAPDLGEPAAVLDTFWGPLALPDGERVYAARGLALRVNPENGLLLEVIGFESTTVEDYLARLRPVLNPTPLVPVGVTS